MSNFNLSDEEIAKLPPEKQELARSLMQRRADLASGKAPQLKSFSASEDAANKEASAPGFFEKGSASDSAMKGLGKGLTFNMDNELSGVLGAADEAIRSVGHDTGQFPGLPMGERMRRRYNMESDAWKQDVTDAERANPNAFLAGELTGALAAPLPGGSQAAALGTKGAVKLLENRALSKMGKEAGAQLLARAGKYGGLAAEGALAGGLQGFGEGEGLKGSLETGFFGTALGGAGAPALSAAGGAAVRGTQKGAKWLSDFFAKEAEQEMSRTALGKGDLMHLPYEQRLDYARRILNLKNEKGENQVNAGNNADELMKRLSYVRDALGVDLGDLIKSTDKAIGEKLGLPTGSADEIRALRGKLTDADNLRMQRAAEAEQATKAAASQQKTNELTQARAEQQRQFAEQQRQFAENQRDYGNQTNSRALMEQSALEKDALLQHKRAEEIAAKRARPEDSDLALSRLEPTNESIENQLARMDLARKTLAQKIRNTLAGKNGKGVRAPFPEEQAKDIVGALSGVEPEQLNDAINQLATHMIKSGDARVMDLPFDSGKLSSYASDTRRLFGEPESVVRRAMKRGTPSVGHSPYDVPTEDLITKNEFWTPNLDTVVPKDRTSDLEFTRRALMENSGRVPLQENELMVSGLSPKTPSKPVKPEAPDVLTDKQIQKQAKAFGENAAPNVKVERDPTLLNGIGVDASPIVNAVRGDLMQMVQAPNLQGRAPGLKRLAARWEKIANEGTSLAELVDFKGAIDKEISNFNKADIDDKLGIHLRGVIDDLVEKEVEKNLGTSGLSAYRNMKGNYGALNEYTGGLDSKAAAMVGNRGMSLTDNMAMNTAVNATIGAAGGAAYDYGSGNGRPGLGTTIGGVVAAGLGNRILRQRAPSALARGYDALSTKLGDMSSGLPLDFKEKLASYLSKEPSVLPEKLTGMFDTKPPGYLPAVAATAAVADDFKPKTRTDKVKQIALHNPGALGPSGSLLLRAILDDQKQGGGGKNFSAAYLQASQQDPKLNDDSYLDSLGVK